MINSDAPLGAQPPKKKLPKRRKPTAKKPAAKPKPK
jgi:hypothetical protein